MSGKWVVVGSVSAEEPVVVAAEVVVVEQLLLAAAVYCNSDNSYIVDMQLLELVAVLSKHSLESVVAVSAEFVAAYKSAEPVVVASIEQVAFAVCIGISLPLQPA